MIHYYGQFDNLCWCFFFWFAGVCLQNNSGQDNKRNQQGSKSFQIDIPPFYVVCPKKARSTEKKQPFLFLSLSEYDNIALMVFVLHYDIANGKMISRNCKLNIKMKKIHAINSICIKMVRWSRILCEYSNQGVTV